MNLATSILAFQLLTPASPGAALDAPVPAAPAPPTPSWLDTAIVSEATRRALDRSGLRADDLRSMASRARAAGWVPRLSARFSRGFGQNTSQLPGPANDRSYLDDSLSFSVSLDLNLDRVVFDPAEVSIERAALQRIERRAALEALVVELLAQMEQARLTLAAPGDGPAAPPDPAPLVAFARARARLEQLTGSTAESLVPRCVAPAARPPERR